MVILFFVLVDLSMDFSWILWLIRSLFIGFILKSSDLFVILVVFIFLKF